MDIYIHIYPSFNKHGLEQCTAWGPGEKMLNKSSMIVSMVTTET